MILAQDDNDQSGKLRNFKKGALFFDIENVHFSFDTQRNYEHSNCFLSEKFLVICVNNNQTVPWYSLDLI